MKIEPPDWPPEWVRAYETFNENPRDREYRYYLWRGWSRELRRQVWYRVSTSVRKLLDDWEQAERDGQQVTFPKWTPTTSQNEETSHNYKEGYPFGGALNPGPATTLTPLRRTTPTNHLEDMTTTTRKGSDSKT